MCNLNFLKKIFIQNFVKSPQQSTITKPKLSQEELNKKYVLQNFYIDASIPETYNKRKKKSTFDLKELINNKLV